MFNSNSKIQIRLIQIILFLEETPATQIQYRMLKNNLISMPAIEVSAVQKAAMKKIERTGYREQQTQMVEAPAIVSGPQQDVERGSSGEFKRHQPNLLSFGKQSQSSSSRQGGKKRTGSTAGFQKSQQMGGTVYAGGQLTKKNLLKFQALQKKANKHKKPDKTLLDDVSNDRIQENAGMFAPNFTMPTQDGSLSKINQASSGRHATKNKTTRQLSSEFKNLSRSQHEKQIIIPKNSRSRCVDLDENMAQHRLNSNISEQIHFGTQNDFIKSSTNVSFKNTEAQQMPITLQTLSQLQQPAKQCINLLVEPEKDPNLRLQFKTENKRAASAVSMHPRKRKQMMSELPSQTLLYPRRQLGPSASTLSKEAELIQGRKIQNSSKLVVQDFDVDPLMMNLKNPKKAEKSYQSTQHQHSQQMYLLRQSEKLIKQGQQVNDAITTSCTIYNLEDPNEMDNATWLDQKVLNFASMTNYGPEKQFDENTRQNNNKKKQQKWKAREALNSSMGIRSVEKTAAQQKMMMTAAAQQRKFLNGLGDKDKKFATNGAFRSKSSTLTKPPIGQKRKPLKNQNLKGDQFKEYLDGKLVHNSASSGLKVTTNKKRKASLASTSLNILTASNKIEQHASTSPQQQQGFVAKKQQKMLLKESNKAAKKTKIGQRSKAHSVVGLSTKQSGNDWQSHRRQSDIQNSQESDLKRKNKSQSPRSHKVLAQAALRDRKSISHSAQSKSRHHSSTFKSHPGLHSSEKAYSRHNFSNKKGSEGSQIKTKSQGRRSSHNRITAECLIADQLRDPQYHSSSVEVRGNESQATLAPFLKNLFTGEGSQLTAASNLASKKKHQEQVSQRNQAMMPAKNSFSFHQLASSKERSESKLDRMIKQNLRRHKAQNMELQNKNAIKLEKEKEKRVNIELENKRVRKENSEMVLRKKHKESSKELEADYNEPQLRKNEDIYADTEQSRQPFQRPRTTFKILAGDQRADEEKENKQDENERSNSQRRSTCGLDFIEIRREIAAEMRNDEIIGEKIKLLKTSVSQRHVQKKDRLGTTSSSAILKNLKNSNGSAALEKLQDLANRTQKPKLPLTQLQQESPAQQQQSQGMQTNGKVNQEDRPIHLKQQQIRKFIKDKKKKDKKVLMREQAQEIKTILQVKENLLKLNKFVAVANKNKQMQQTAPLREQLDRTALQQKFTGVRLQRPQQKGVIQHRISKKQINIVDSVRKLRDNMGTLTPSNQLPFEQSEKSMRIDPQNSHILSIEEQKRSDYQQLYEDSVGKQNESIVEQNQRPGIVSIYNPPRRVLQPILQVCEESNQISRTKFKRSSRVQEKATHASYYEHSSRESSSNSRQAAFKRLKKSKSRSPQISRKSYSLSPNQQDKQKPQKASVKAKAKKVTPSIKVKQQKKRHLRSKSKEIQPTSTSTIREIQKSQHHVQPKSTKIQVQYQERKKYVKLHKMTREQAATKIQRAVKRNLERIGFYQEQSNNLSQFTVPNSLTSPEKQLFDFHIDRESDESFDPDGLNVQIIVDMQKPKNALKLQEKFIKNTVEENNQDSAHQDFNTNLLMIDDQSSSLGDSKEVQEQTEFIAVRQSGANKPSIQAQLKEMMDKEPDEDSSRDHQSILSNAKISDSLDDINRRGATWLNKNKGQHKSAQELERVDEMMHKPPPLLLVHEEKQEEGERKVGGEGRGNDLQGQYEKSHMLHVEGLSPQTQSDRFTGLDGMIHQPSQLSIESKQNSSTSNLHIPLKNAQTPDGSKSQKSSKTSGSLFDRNAFQRQKLANLQHDNEYQQLIKFREEWLVFKEKKENKAIQKLLKNNMCSPRSYQEKKNQIDKWVDIQKQDLQKTKLVFQQEWDKTVQMIEETQKNVDQMKEKVGGPQQLRVDSKSSQSVLMEDPPKSYRSGQQSLVSQGLSNLMAQKNNGIFEEDTENDSLLKKMNQIPGPEDSEASLSQHMGHEPSQELLERLERAFSKNPVKSVSKPEEKWSPTSLPHKESAEIEQVINNFNDEPLSSDKGTGKVAIENFRDSVMDMEEDIDFEQREVQDGTTVKELKVIESESEKIPAIVDEEDDNEIVVQQFSENSQNYPKEDMSGPDLSEPDIMSPPKSEKKDEESQQTKSFEFANKSFDNEPAIISGQSATFETHPDPCQVGEPPVTTQIDSQAAVDMRLNLYQKQNFNDLDDLFENHQTSFQKNDLADHITETLLQEVLKELHQNFPPERKQEEKNTKVLGKKKQEEPVSEVYIVDLTYAQKEERREWIEMHHRNLIERELYQSDTYIGEALERLLLYEIDSSDESDDDYGLLSKKSKVEPLNQFAKEHPLNLHIQFLKALTQPIVRSQATLLQSLQIANGPSYAHFETSFEVQKFPIIPVDLYLEVERQRDEDDQQDRARLKEQLNSSVELSVVVESVHIQNKCYFDALNESLMKFRPYGITGEPMPWSTKIRRLQTKVDINSVDTERLFQMVKHDLFRWASAFCGSLPTSDFLLPIMNNKNRKAEEKFNDELFQETRDKRLSQVLHSETVEQEHHWLNFEFEESKVKLDLADAVLDKLILEMAEFLNEKAGMKPEIKQILPPIKDEMPSEKPSKLDTLFGDLQKYTREGENIVGNPQLMQNPSKPVKSQFIQF